jgi:high-affinity nickel-transport protein
MLLLGLRHGFDPDHIAIIDGVSMRFSSTRPRLASWSGTLFAAGHGAVITLVAVMISLFNHSITLPTQAWAILDWIPGLLLILVGLVNLRSLLWPGVYRPHGIRSHILPPRLRRSSHPLAIVFMGILFALVFDSTTQAAAWAYTATSKLTTTLSLLLGIAFSLGMMLTDSTDSRVLSLLVKRSKEQNISLSYRRKLGWIITCISLLAGGYKVTTLMYPAWSLSERILSWVGIVFFCTMAAFYLSIVVRKPAPARAPVAPSTEPVPAPKN